MNPTQMEKDANAELYALEQEADRARERNCVECGTLATNLDEDGLCSECLAEAGFEASTEADCGA